MLTRYMFVLAFCIVFVATIPGSTVITAQEPQAQATQERRLSVTADSIRSVAAIGDSIAKAFNGQSAFLCPNADQEQYNWVTSNTNGSNFCGTGSEGVFSLTERLKCLQSAEVISPTPNQARSGARMLADFVNQANAVKTYISARPAPRLTAVLLGHNDLCSANVLKFHDECAAGADQNGNDYCRTSAAAFEREFRKGLDILITVPNMTIGVASLVRATQLCSQGSKISCQSFTNCQTLWSTFTALDTIFGDGNGICGSLTINCSDNRVADAYETAKSYRDILQNVTAEYALIPEGGRSRTVTIGGQTVGGAVKAVGANLVYSDATWMYKFSSNQLSCCDCFHPSGAGQSRLAEIALNGLTCSAETPCCQDTGDPAGDGRCTNADTSGTTYPGFFGNP